MTEGAETSPLLRFQSSVRKALKYGKVFVQGEAVHGPGDAETKVEAASQENNTSRWREALLPDVRIPALSETEAAAALKISALLASLINTLEGRLRHVLFGVVFLPPSFCLLACVCSDNTADTVQASLDPYLALLRAFDTHSKQLRMDFLYPVGQPRVFQPNARPDLTNAPWALFWEVRFVSSCEPSCANDACVHHISCVALYLSSKTACIRRAKSWARASLLKNGKSCGRPWKECWYFCALRL
jgi:hypothetical protein